MCGADLGRNGEHPLMERLPSKYQSLGKFRLAESDQKHYQQQYGDLYFLRLAKLRAAVEHVAEIAWADFEAGRRYAKSLDNAHTNMSLGGRRGGTKEESSPRRPARRALLGGWDSLYGHASQA